MVTVILAFPVAFAVIKPEFDTVATVVLLEEYVTDLSVALLGETVTVNCCVPSTSKDAFVGLTETPVTETVEEPPPKELMESLLGVA